MYVAIHGGRSWTTRTTKQKSRMQSGVGQSRLIIIKMALVYSILASFVEHLECTLGKMF